MTTINEEQKRQVFEMFDTDNSGRVSVTEMQKAFSQMLGVDIPKEDFEKILEKFDTDKSKDLDFEEFCTMGDNIDEFLKEHNCS